jgi:methyl-accepting chemotaxis protein
MGNLLHTIRAKLIASILLLSLTAVLIGVVGLYKLTDLNQRINLVANIAAQRVIHVDHASEGLLSIVLFQRSMILENDEAKIKQWQTEIQKADTKVRSELDGWDKIASEKGRKELEEVRQHYDDLIKANNRVMELALLNKDSQAQELSTGEAWKAFEGANEHLDKSQQIAQDFMVEEAEIAAAANVNTRWTMIGIVLFGIGGAFGFGWFMVNQTTRRINKVSDYIKDVAEGDGDLTKRIHVEHNDELGILSNHFNTFMEKLHDIISQVAASTEHIASASEEISSSATQVAQSAETQKDQTSQVATAMQEMSSTVNQVSDNSRQASENAKEAGDLARTGGTVVSDTVKVIQGVADATRDTSAKIVELGRSSDQIGQIIGVIDDIADQTNLLALNAAIEAARAGEQGRGFAVVADEVRKLAERTTQATKEIAQMIKTIQEETKKAVAAMQAGTDKVDAGVESAREAGAALEKIIHSADGVQDMVTHIATAATEQASATEQVNSNMEQIAKMVHQSSIGAQESARACQDLSNLALDLQQLVGRFKLADRRTEQQHTSKTARRKSTTAANQYLPRQVSEPVGMVQ